MPRSRGKPAEVRIVGALRRPLPPRLFRLGSCASLAALSSEVTILMKMDTRFWIAAGSPRTMASPLTLGSGMCSTRSWSASSTTVALCT
eukprot:scaffold287_cov239-Pinguiococcus_pyrenoidosus.AAC.9